MVKQVIPGGRRALPTPLTQADKDDIAAGVSNVAIQAAETNAADISKINDVVEPVVVYISASGSDTADGLAPSRAIRTWQELINNRIVPGKLNNIHVIGDVDVDYYTYVSNSPRSIRFLDAGSGRLIFKNSSNLASHTGLWFEGHTGIRFDVDIVLDSTSTLGVVNVTTHSANQTVLVGCTITQTATNTLSLFFVGSGGFSRSFFLSSPVSNISGNVFTTVAAGAAPGPSISIISNIPAG